MARRTSFGRDAQRTAFAAVVAMVALVSDARVSGPRFAPDLADNGSSASTLGR